MNFVLAFLRHAIGPGGIVTWTLQGALWGCPKGERHLNSSYWATHLDAPGMK